MKKTIFRLREAMHFSGIALVAATCGLAGCSTNDSSQVMPMAKVVGQNRVPSETPCGAYIGVDCPGGNTQYIPNFYSTEGTTGYDAATSNGDGAYNGPDNPNGYILDFKGAQADLAGNIQVLDGYTAIALNLNRGTNGKAVFLTFTRNPSKVRDYFGQGTLLAVTGLEAQATSTFTPPSLGPDEQKVVRPDNNVSNPADRDFQDQDFNEGAGGPFILMGESKDFFTSGKPKREFGILRLNAGSTAPPPTTYGGYTLVNGSIDLNQNANGSQPDRLYLYMK